mmetsp:Transcript_1774/g.3866  ORF Transcript_1774/g.3866 Transcript_1774/m.3866 type:complete len:245 (-) Transcript_1774:266-1000(-)
MLQNILYHTPLLPQTVTLSSNTQTMDSKSSLFSADDFFAKIEANLKKEGAFQVGKCHGKPAATTTRGGGGSQTVKKALFPSLLASPPRTREHATTAIIADEPTKRGHSRSPCPIIETDAEPPPYIPVCMRNDEAQSKTLRTASPPRSSFQSFSWQAPSFNAGLDLSRFAGHKKRLSEETTEDEGANTATAKIAAVAARVAASGGQSSSSFDFLTGPRYTEEDIDAFVSLSNKFICDDSKRARNL